jgi:hypothetical protein
VLHPANVQQYAVAIEEEADDEGSCINFFVRVIDPPGRWEFEHDITVADVLTPTQKFANWTISRIEPYEVEAHCVFELS